jgi:thimet oligopeptidase
MCSFRKIVLALLALAAVACAYGQTKPSDPLHAWVVVGSDPAALEAWINQRLDEEKADIAKLLAEKGSRTIENTLRPFDDAQNQLATAQNRVDSTSKEISLSLPHRCWRRCFTTPQFCSP